MESSLIVEIATSYPNIVGIKEASGSLLKLSQIIADAPDGFAVLQGFDELIVPSLSVGAAGSINSLACVAPNVFMRIYESMEKGDHRTAAHLQLQMLPIAAAIYAETNPVGLKKMLDMLGLHGGPSRPPLHAIASETEGRLKVVAEEIRQLEQLHAGLRHREAAV